MVGARTMKNLLPGSTQAVKGWGCLSSFPGIRDMRAHSKTPAVVSKIETIGIIPRTRNATWARSSPSLYYLISLRTQSGLGCSRGGLRLGEEFEVWIWIGLGWSEGWASEPKLGSATRITFIYIYTYTLCTVSWIHVCGKIFIFEFHEWDPPMDYLSV